MLLDGPGNIRFCPSVRTFGRVACDAGAGRAHQEPSRPLFGPPEAIAARLREYVAAGFSTVIVEVPAPYDIETLERLIG